MNLMRHFTSLIFLILFSSGFFLNTALGQTKTRVFQHDQNFQANSLFFNQAPSIERLPNGRLVMVWVSGLNEGNLDNRIVISHSDDNGSNWSAPVVVFDPE